MEIAPIGRAPDAAQLDLEPIIVPIVAYKEDGTEVVERFPFRAVMKPGAMSYMIRNSGPNGEMSTNAIQNLLLDTIDADAKDRWTAFLDSDEYFILQETLGEVWNALVEVYAKRPTRQRSGSAGTGAPVAPTSPAAPPSQELTSTV